MRVSGLPDSEDSNGREVLATRRKASVTSYKFGSYLLDQQRGCLLHDGQEIKLRPKSFEVLAYFVENHGRLITKDELIKAVWRGAYVTDDSLVQCVRDIRRALGDDSQQQIKTAPRRGYIFAAEVISNGAGNAQILSAVTNGQEPMPAAAAASAPRDIVSHSGPSVARRLWPWFGPVLVTVALISAVLALYRSHVTTSTVWRPVPLTSYPGFEFNPALSPDNRSVAFTWNGEAQDNFDIYVQPVDHGHPQRLTTDPAQDSSPAWSPSGDKIAFLRRIDADRNHLILIPATGGPEQILAETRMPVVAGSFASDLRMSLAWTPDGQWIVSRHRQTEGSSNGLYLFSVLTGEKRLLIQTPAGYFDENPAFSLKGDAIAFARHLNSSNELYVAPLSKDLHPSGSARHLTNESGSRTHPVWAKDGSRIFYRSESGLRVVNVASSHDAPEAVLLETADIAELSLKRDLVYSQTQFDANIWRAEIPSGNRPPTSPHLLIGSTRADNSPQYSPNGKAIAFRSSRSGVPEIWIANADGSNPVQVTSFGAPGIFFPNWSPNGLRFVFHARPDGQGDIFSVAASGGPPKRLTTDPSDDYQASYSQDGRWIYFSSLRSGQGEVWKMPAEGGDATRLTIGGGWMPVESPDQKSVFYARSTGAESGIWKIPVEGGEPVRVTGPIAKDPAFAVSMEGIYYVTPPESPTRQLIHFLDFSTKQSRPVVVADREIGLGLSLSSDGRYLIFAQRDQAGSDLMLIRNFGAQN